MSDNMNNENGTTAKKRGGNAKYLCKVAGVTYGNADGESRQEIMKTIVDRDGNGTAWAGPGTLRIIKGEDAFPKMSGNVIEVYVKGKLIGFVPNDKKQQVIDNKKTQGYSVIVQLQYLRQHDVYRARLYEPSRVKPTERMKYAVAQVLAANPGLEAPEETFDAYRQFLNKYKGGVLYQLRAKDYLLDYED